jgi:hypothetical protein
MGQWSMVNHRCPGNLFDFDETRNGSGVVDDYLNRALYFVVAIT